MKKNISILDAMDDPKLFGPWFRGKSWNAWRVFLAALFGLRLTDEQLALYSKHTGRSVQPSSPSREAWLCCGRRAGKSLIAALLAVYLALFRSYAQHLAPGELATIAIVAADRKQARVILRYVRGFVNGVPMLAKMVTRELKESIEFSNRTVIEVQTASYRTIRGYTLAAAINDEIAFWVGDEESAEPSGEILAAERPALTTIPGALLLSLSSPHARRGPLWEAFRTLFGKEGAPALFWKASSREMNCALDEQIIAEAYERDPVAADAEYGGNFRADCEAFVSREAVEACVVKGRIETPRVERFFYFAFTDPSGGSADSMTLAIGHNHFGKVTLDAVREKKPPFSPEAVVAEFAQLLKAYGISTVFGDAYAGEWPRERFRVHGIEYRPSDKTRSELYLEFLPLLNSRSIALLDNPRLVSQIAALERHTGRSGKETIDHPPSGHDDLANAVAGAIVKASRAVSTVHGGGGVMFYNGFSPSQEEAKKLNDAQDSRPPWCVNPADPRAWKGRRGGLV